VTEVDRFLCARAHYARTSLRMHDNRGRSLVVASKTRKDRVEAPTRERTKVRFRGSLKLRPPLEITSTIKSESNNDNAYPGTCIRAFGVLSYAFSSHFPISPVALLFLVSPTHSFRSLSGSRRSCKSCKAILQINWRLCYSSDNRRAVRLFQTNPR